MRRTPPVTERRFEVYDQAGQYLGSTAARSQRLAVAYYTHRGARYAHLYTPPLTITPRPAGPFDHCMTGSRFD